MHGKVRGLLFIIALGLLESVCGRQDVEAQSTKTLWDSHAELREWISFPTAEPDEDSNIAELTEGGRDFIRIVWREMRHFPRIAMPNDPNFDFGNLTSLPTLLNPRTHNAVSITLRHNMSFDLLVGAWVHRNWVFDENLSTEPNFRGVTVPAGSAWTEVQLKLNESPFFDANSDVVFMTFAMTADGLSWREVGERYDALPVDAHLDIDRIEFLNLPDDTAKPEIRDFNPKRGYGGTLITVQGSGFAEPATANVVAIGGVVANVISGGPTELLIEAPSSVTSPIGVLVPGGRAAVSTDSFEYLPNPADLRIVDGNNQTATVGSTLLPFRVQVVAGDGAGIPDQTISFQLVEGHGVLSDAAAVSDEHGLASVQLTLGTEPGAVRVEAVLERLKAFKVVFDSTAIPQ